MMLLIKNAFLAGIGATVTLECAPEYAENAVFTEEAAAKLASAGHVAGVNQRCSDYALPVGVCGITIFRCKPAVLFHAQ